MLVARRQKPNTQRDKDFQCHRDQRTNGGRPTQLVSSPNVIGRREERVVFPLAEYVTLESSPAIAPVIQ
ncbi:hypothetical protein V5799_033026 [Amblyomma americanum]|uniref:Uncharacterized protein n=1 Tax=Amblyomma americanum TaxID=6943 RepID=A0AAQ4DPH9_AMBAM